MNLFWKKLIILYVTHILVLILHAIAIYSRGSDHPKFWIKAL
jgi:hypothetical protein